MHALLSVRLCAEKLISFLQHAHAKEPSHAHTTPRVGCACTPYLNFAARHLTGDDKNCSKSVRNSRAQVDYLFSHNIASIVRHSDLGTYMIYNHIDDGENELVRTGRGRCSARRLSSSGKAAVHYGLRRQGPTSAHTLARGHKCCTAAPQDQSVGRGGVIYKMKQEICLRTPTPSSKDTAPKEFDGASVDRSLHGCHTYAYETSNT